MSEMSSLLGAYPGSRWPSRIMTTRRSAAADLLLHANKIWQPPEGQLSGLYNSTSSSSAATLLPGCTGICLIICLVQPMNFNVLQMVAVVTANIDKSRSFISCRYMPGFCKINLSRSSCSKSPSNLSGP